MEKMMIRHGDVVIIKVELIPSTAVSLGSRKEIAYGEVTGHAHRLDVGELFEEKNGDIYLKIDKLAKVSHEEHKTVTLTPGVYKAVIKRQYTPEGWKKVVD